MLLICKIDLFCWIDQFFFNNLIIPKKKLAVLKLYAADYRSKKIYINPTLGPEYHLRSVGIKPKKNLAVGENLQSHVGTGNT